MTALDITNALMRERFKRSFILPRYTPVRWWECDVFEITKAGYFREYEVKISLADYRADAEKESRSRIRMVGGKWEDVPGKRKHEQIGQPEGPVEFYYVCPEGLLTPEIVPSWAGLIVMRDRGENWNRWSRYVETTLKPAPRLHKSKVADSVRQHAESVCYWRLHNEWQNRRAA